MPTIVTKDGKRELKVVYTNDKKAYVHYPSDQSAADLQAAMNKHGVPFDSKGVGSSPWWSILTSLLPFVLLFTLARTRQSDCLRDRRRGRRRHRFGPDLGPVRQDQG